MTILPTKRANAGNNEESVDNGQQNNNGECTVRRRDDHNISQISTLSDQPASSRRSQFNYSASSDRKDRCFKKRYKESERPRDREREREQKRETRREQKRDRVAKRDLVSEPILDIGASSSSVVPVQAEPVVESARSIIQEDCTGFNSEDEYDCHNVVKDRLLTDEEWQARDEIFARCIASLGFEIKLMNEDGACLFRSIADQVYGDQELHFTVRTHCMDYIVKNKDYFAPYVTEDFDKYIARKRKWNVHGNHLEIQAMSEMYNRTIEVYCYQLEPINIFNGPNIINSNEPIRLSYHRMCHYNSISNPNNPSVGVGLGLPNYHTIDLNRRRFNDAVRASEELLIEQTMLEDKIKATDWEATNEAIEDQVARESYIQYIRDSERKSDKPSSSSVGRASTSNGARTPRGRSSPIPHTSRETSSQKSSPSSSPVLGFSHNQGNGRMSFTYHDQMQLGSLASTSSVDQSAEADLYRPGTSTGTASSPLTNSGKYLNDCQNRLDTMIMNRVMEESRRTFIEDLKRSHKRNGASPS